MDRDNPSEYEISCESLGIATCHRTFRAPSAGEVVDKISEHLRSEHNIDLPESEVVLRSSDDLDTQVAIDRFMGMGYSKKAILVMRRMRELLNVATPAQDEPQDI